MGKGRAQDGVFFPLFFLDRESFERRICRCVAPLLDAII